MASAFFVGIFALWEIGSFVSGLLRTPEQAAPDVEAAKKTPEEPPAAKPKARASRAKVSDSAAAPAPAPPVWVRREPPFPTEKDITPGMGREDLRAEFGEPRLRASSYERGSLLETFVYQNEARNAVTGARLLNGNVIAAETAAIKTLPAHD
ncbi:MAG: hypothetical protein ACM3S5_14935 [Rhodospirillales bacterium]